MQLQFGVAILLILLAKESQGKGGHGGNRVRCLRTTELKICYNRSFLCLREHHQEKLFFTRNLSHSERNTNSLVCQNLFSRGKTLRYLNKDLRRYL